MAQVLFMLVLARAVGPAGFAAASISLIGYQLSSTLASQSFSMALVRYAEPDDGREAAAFWLNIAIVALPVIITVLLGVPTARLLEIPEIAWLLPCMTGLGLIAAPTVLAQARMSRAMAFRRIAGIETASSLAGAAAGAAAALLGAGLMGLVVYAGVQRLVEAVSFMRGATAWPKGRPNRAEIPALLRFTAPLAGMQVLSFANGSVDQFFVGQAGTPVTLGYYGLARRFSQQPTQMITFAVNRAIYPALVHAQETPNGQARIFLQAARFCVMLASLPLSLLAITSADLLWLAMGPGWVAAAPYLALFAITSGSLPVGGVFAAALRAEGRTAAQLIFQVVRLVVTLVLLGTMTLMGVDIWWIAVTVAVIAVLSLVLPAIEISRVLPVTLTGLAREMLIGLLPAMTMLAVQLGLRIAEITPDGHLPRLAWEMAIGAMIGAAAAAFAAKSARRRPRKSGESS
ncbi:oligosaccharide flippase family protein [Salipiger thiooxidans]|uniref:oligosaccharide flippase family protein n=1 Tax=Salipiger thiooxidans TaxID=282683 RepID=UPI00299D11CC|nr:oligosaccharide flippase family protein [Salipiger thiooxidans]